MIPQIIILCFAFGSLVLTAAKNGESKGKYKFGPALVAAIFEFIILWWGGFFNCFGW